MTRGQDSLTTDTQASIATVNAQDNFIFGRLPLFTVSFTGI